MRGCVKEQRESAEREIRKNRRAKDNHLGWREDLRDAWGEAEMQKYRRRFGNERKRESA